ENIDTSHRCRHDDIPGRSATAGMIATAVTKKGIGIRADTAKQRNAPRGETGNIARGAAAGTESAVTDLGISTIRTGSRIQGDGPAAGGLQGRRIEVEEDIPAKAAGDRAAAVADLGERTGTST